jgi:hypothetical protein
MVIQYSMFMKTKYNSTVVYTNDDLFDRLETVRFFRHFTGEGDWRTRAEVIQNPEA